MADVGSSRGKEPRWGSTVYRWSHYTEMCLSQAGQLSNAGVTEEYFKL